MSVFPDNIISMQENIIKQLKLINTDFSHYKTKKIIKLFDKINKIISQNNQYIDVIKKIKNKVELENNENSIIYKKINIFLKYNTKLYNNKKIEDGYMIYDYNNYLDIYIKNKKLDIINILDENNLKYNRVSWIKLDTNKWDLNKVEKCDILMSEKIVMRVFKSDDEELEEKTEIMVKNKTELVTWLDELIEHWEYYYNRKKLPELIDFILNYYGMHQYLFIVNLKNIFNKIEEISDEIILKDIYDILSKFINYNQPKYDKKFVFKNYTIFCTKNNHLLYIQSNKEEIEKVINEKFKKNKIAGIIMNDKKYKSLDLLFKDKTELEIIKIIFKL